MRSDHDLDWGAGSKEMGWTRTQHLNGQHQHLAEGSTLVLSTSDTVFTGDRIKQQTKAIRFGTVLEKKRFGTVLLPFDSVSFILSEIQFNKHLLSEHLLCSGHNPRPTVNSRMKNEMMPDLKVYVPQTKIHQVDVRLKQSKIYS